MTYPYEYVSVPNGHGGWTPALFAESSDQNLSWAWVWVLPDDFELNGRDWSKMGFELRDQFPLEGERLCRVHLPRWRLGTRVTGGFAASCYEALQTFRPRPA